ncbi:SpvB/TcaC N-terminal domain-containing protein, partial [Elioraea tepidiphila]|uniref:SpvB/TcaC N-terminal domain-containing protein n=1 Tax=Elioraea tepidiphila TaxID=457934 RepID=UPI003CCBCD95
MSLPGSFEVTEAGAASYAIPIQVPPGAGGIEPKLSLVYRSQGSNGLLGVGCDLPPVGPAFIVRARRGCSRKSVLAGAAGRRS